MSSQLHELCLAQSGQLRARPLQGKSGPHGSTDISALNCTHCATPVPETATFCPNCVKPLESATPADPVAEVAKALKIRYDVNALIGKGAFGEVYKARDILLNRTVAIKRVRLDWLGNDDDARDIQRRFIREAQVAAQLQHPNIVTIYDVVSAGNSSYIIMEYIDGTTLAAKLARKKSIPLSETVYTLSRVAKALHHAHEHKVVHRDVKPANILLSREGHVKVTDFGVAKVESARDATRAGMILGTPHYMSPEQAGGGTVDGRSDLFSLGCILYQCVTGEPPFRATSMTGVLIRIVNDEPDPIDTEQRGLPFEVQAIVDRALAKDLTKRYSSAVELASALDAIPGASASQAIPVNAGDGEVTRENTYAGVEHDSAAPDSVADSLMKEARQTRRIRPQLLAFKEEKRKLRLARSPLLQFRNVTLTPEEAYILSRIQENILPQDILSVSPLSEEETARTLLGFLRTGLVAFVDEETSTESVTGRLEPNRRQAPPRAEIERFYRELREANDWDVLGVSRASSRQDVKLAFQTRAFRFHPDRYAVIEGEEFQEKVSWLFQRVSEAFVSLSTAETQGRPA